MENNELKFAKILEDIKYVARAQGGFIKEDDVYEALDEMDLSKEQYQMVFEYLNNNKIGIDKPLDDAQILSTPERDLISEYTKDLNSIMGISDGEKEAYVMAAMNNDKEAMQKLINYYLPKVVEISKLYLEQGVMLEDLIGEGNLAVAEGVTMLGALETPDEADGMMIKLIMDAMENSISINLTEHSNDEKLASKVNKWFAQYS